MYVKAERKFQMSQPESECDCICTPRCKCLVSYYWNFRQGVNRQPGLDWTGDRLMTDDKWDTR